MNEIIGLKMKLLKELADYSENGKYSSDDVENIKNLSGAIDHLCNIVEDEEYSYEYSGQGGRGGNRGGNRGGSSRGNSYNGSSYARGRTGNVRRDSMGRYSRDDAEDAMIDALEEYMETVSDPMKKKEAERFLAKVDR